MKIVLYSIGKTKEKYLKTGIQDYLGRLKHYTSFDYKEWSGPKGKMSPDQLLDAQGAWIMKQMDAGDTLILLDEGGKQFSSRKFAHQIDQWLMHTPGKVIFVIGGAYGFSQTVKQKANALLSLSEMTFSHQMVRLFILEQIYRAFTILRGESYHND